MCDIKSVSMYVGVYTRVCVYVCESGSVCAFERKGVCVKERVYVGM